MISASDVKRVPAIPAVSKLSSSISVRSTSSGLNSFRTDDSHTHYTAAALYRADWHLRQQDDLVTPCQARKMTTTDFHLPPTNEVSSVHANDPIPDFGPWTGHQERQFLSKSSLTTFDNASQQAPPSVAAPTGGNKKTQYHKTKICPWHREGKCFMGANCNYAHSRDDLRPKPDLSKTKLCPEFMKGRQCTRTGCRFAHDFVELRATSAFFKTRVCKFWQRGYCPAGEACRHAHGRDDLRASAIPTMEPLSTVTDTTTGSSSGSGFNSSAGESRGSQAPSTGGRKCRMSWGSGSSNVVPPAASQLPSPSFLSTSAASPSPTRNRLGPNSAPMPVLQHCAALLGGASRTGDEGALNLLKSWISQEVERQVQIRQQASETEPDESSFLPADVLQGLNTTTPANSRGWLAPRSPDATTTSGASPATFAAAVQSMVTGVSPADHPEDPTPTRLLLKGFGDLPNPSWCTDHVPSFPPMSIY